MPGITVLSKPGRTKPPSPASAETIEYAGEEENETTEGEDAPPTTADDVDMAEDQHYPEHMRKKKFGSQQELLRKFELKHEYDKNRGKDSGVVKPVLNKRANRAP